jgi:hypothetical protein
VAVDSTTKHSHPLACRSTLDGNDPAPHRHGFVRDESPTVGVFWGQWPARRTPASIQEDLMGRTRIHPGVLAAAVGIAAATTLGVNTPAFARVGEPAFYVDGEVYRTVGTPTDLSGTDAPAHAWDVIYDLGDAQLNVAEAAPGDRDYNGGRWMVHAVTFPDGYAAALSDGDLDGDGVLDSAEEVRAALAAGSAIDAGTVRQFECPVIPLLES